MARTHVRPRTRLDALTRRSEILEHAVTAFDAAAYDEVTVAGVAELAGTSEALVYRYFATKAGLYAEAVQLAIRRLMEALHAADAALPPGVSARDRVRSSLSVFLDHVASRPRGWAAPQEEPATDPASAAAIRRQARAASVEMLRGFLRPDQGLRRDYALHGFVGYVETACLRWVDQGCPDSHRASLIEAALGCLEGALGDWGS